MKYCILKDQPMPGLASGEQILIGCEIYGVHHECEKCPNLMEMGEGSYSISATEPKLDTMVEQGIFNKED